MGGTITFWEFDKYMGVKDRKRTKLRGMLVLGHGYHMRISK